MAHTSNKPNNNNPTGSNTNPSSSSSSSSTAAAGAGGAASSAAANFIDDNDILKCLRILCEIESCAPKLIASSASSSSSNKATDAEDPVSSQEATCSDVPSSNSRSTQLSSQVAFIEALTRIESILVETLTIDDNAPASDKERQCTKDQGNEDKQEQFEEKKSSTEELQKSDGAEIKDYHKNSENSNDDDEDDDDDDEDSDDDKTSRFVTDIVDFYAPSSSGSSSSSFNSASLLSVMNLTQNKNHLVFFPYAIKWLEMCRKYLNETQVFTKQFALWSSSGRASIVLESALYLLEYLCNILNVLNYISSISSNRTSDIDAQEYQANAQADWVDEEPCFNFGEDDDESLLDDSDDESLCSKLCTYTVTQRDYASQHWYHCYTCDMVEKAGVCSVCAKVCHKDHDISYARFGAFSCDCAIRGDGMCAALMKRSIASGNVSYDLPGNRPYKSDNIQRNNRPDSQSRLSADTSNVASTSANTVAPSSFEGAANDSSREVAPDTESSIQQHLVKQLEPMKDEFLNMISQSNVTSTILSLLTSIIPAYVKIAHDESHSGRSKRVQAALETLHSRPKIIHMTEDLMLPTLGSQEGAFENVRPTYSGKHSSLIRKLIANYTLRRVAMTSLSSPSGKRQHLVVCHERGKITLLQLNAFLRQADSSKKKLTLTRLASAPIPFSVISIAANPFNEDVLAICGLKDCHVLTFTSAGIVSSHIEINLDLANSNDYITKAVWLPGGQTELAVLTSEVVKIYDLSENSSKPKFFFKLTFGQLIDITFVVPESKSRKSILMMDTAGHIFRQELHPNTMITKNFSGPHFVTTELEMPHPDLKEVDGRINGGGLSVYYSHSFKMLFFSFQRGNYMASLPDHTEVKQVFPLCFEFSSVPLSSQSTSQLTYASVTAGTDDSSSQDELSQQSSRTENVKPVDRKNFQPLCQWSEVPGHVGLIMAVCQQSNNPVIMFIQPDCVFAQEIRCLSADSKIIDTTAIRHRTSSGEVRTTLILLCEDGSLRIYMASQEVTDFWLTLSLNPNTALGGAPFSILGKSYRRKKAQSKISKKVVVHSGANPVFPTDFFENLVILSDLEYSGRELLTIYTTQQIKTRLNDPSKSITCAKPAGFVLDVINNDLNMVFCGIQVQVGSQDVTRAPTSITIFGRQVPINPASQRWYDLPFTREESLQAEKKFTITFGPSGDVNNLTTVDSVKVYGQSKESFSWPDDGDNHCSSSNVCGDDLLCMALGRDSGNRFQKLFVSSLETFQYCLSLDKFHKDHQNQLEEFAQDLSSSIFTVPYSPQILRPIKNLLMTIYSSRQNYNHHRDSAALNFLMSSFASFRPGQIDCELFSRVVHIMKSLCQSRLSNFGKLSEYWTDLLIKENPDLAPSLQTEAAKIIQLINYVRELFWHLYSHKPTNISLVSVATPGYISLEDILQPIVEFIYIATLHDLTILPSVGEMIIEFLLFDDLAIALCVRHILIKLLRVKGVHHSESAEHRSNDAQLSHEPRSATIEEERIQQQHLKLLQILIEHLPDTRVVGGPRSISLFHVVLVLTLSLDWTREADGAILKDLLRALRDELRWNTGQPESISVRNPDNEVKLVIMRMFSILMSKMKTSSVASTVSSSTRAEVDSWWSTFCSFVTATVLIESDCLEFFYSVLEHMIEYWRSVSSVISSNQVTSSTLTLANETIQQINRKTLPKPLSHSYLPDLSPFFLRQHGKNQDKDLFDEYPQLLTEMLLRLPCQLRKISICPYNDLEHITFPSKWSSLLCEYLMVDPPSGIKKHVRKLLTCICGSKEKYRQMRDFHFIESHIKHIKTLCGITEDDLASSQKYQGISDDIRQQALSYESMAEMVDRLKSCIDIAQSRCINWQLYCLIKDQTLLPFLMKISLNFNDDVSPIVLELLQHALSSPSIASNQDMTNLFENSAISTTDVISEETIGDTLTSESLGANLSQQLITSISKELLSSFVQKFLLETNLTSLRWQAHSLLYNLWSNFLPNQQVQMVHVFWSLWKSLPKYGRKASQFVDLIGFITLRSSREQDEMFCEETLSVLRKQNQLLINHPNALIYSSLQNLVDLECFYLESEPCSVCNSPEIPYNTVKLSSIKVDSRFTTTTQIIKLVGSHTILRFSLRISDVKRNKMVKAISIYYNNRSVQSVVDLKNKTGIWNLARKYSLAPAQTDVKIEFLLPIVACNLMIEFSEFYENFQASSETLQCPRCSTSVSANPGVCSNCGENVFQCHKCRAINYDEKDPFLCISCGFCKYARFDISLTAKPTCAVDPIENEEDRKKTVASISNLLEKADRVYKSLVQNKPALELLLLRIHEQNIPDKQFDENILGADQGSMPFGHGLANANQSNSIPAQSIAAGYANCSSMTALSASVNKAIQHLAQKYCVECKGYFEDLSKITHKILASRRELVEYDNRQLRRCLNAGSSALTSANRRKSRVYSSLSSGSGKCYGCATAAVEHCVTMLKALSTVHKYRAQICASGIISELVSFNLRNGSNAVAQEVRLLLCSLTRDDFESTTTLTGLLTEKIAAISKQDIQRFEIFNIVRHEIALLSVTLDSDDQCWELRLRCLIKIFAMAFELKNPSVMECLIIPCLRLLLSIIRPPPPKTMRHQDKTLENIASVRSDNFRSRIVLQEWLNDSSIIFDDWRKRASRPSTLTQSNKPISSILRRTARMQFRSNYLAEKYGNKWRLKSSKFNQVILSIETLPNDWLKQLIFNQASKTVRLMSKSLIEALFSVQSRRKEIIELLTSYLTEIGPAGECAYEFYHCYKNIILTDHWRYYLALQGVLVKISELVTEEIDKLQELEETTLNSSLSLGYSLKMLIELMTSFVTVPKIRSYYKSKLVGLVLKGYLSLRKLVVQRSKTIDETQEMLLELLEGMTTGSESETAAFIDVCVEAIKNCHEGDLRTPVFIFERLCSTIHPEENVHSEFFVSLEKDPQQEDYLQGRMLGNPYSSNELGIGPLMRDVKNKICQDCELLALLEDDSSMELLVSNKIISLDLPIREVYKRVWCSENHESDAMRIVYRMRGLLGDATEEFIESLDPHKNEVVDDEQVYKMANIMSTSGGLEVMLQRLRQIDDLSPPFKPLLDVILKLFTYCTKTRENRLKLLAPELQTVEIALSTLKLALNEESFLDFAGFPKKSRVQDLSSTTGESNKQPAGSQPCPKTQVVDQILAILETVLREASQQPEMVFQQFCSTTCGTSEDLRFLLNAAHSLYQRLPHVSQKIIQVLSFLTLGNRDKMSVLIDYFKPSLDFEWFDRENSTSNSTNIDLFCILVSSIESNENGYKLKDFILSERVVANSIKYLTQHAPPLRSSFLATSDGWEDFTSKPALKYVLRILDGLSQGHASTQVLISRECIPIVHGLEQVASIARVGTLAENLLESIKQHPMVGEKVEQVRKQTREEKKRLAMAVRERQLGALGMKANERGQVTAKSKLLEQCLDLTEDTGLICNICREGNKYQPNKVLGIYTYTKRCVLEEFELKSRKTYGYTTVTHFNTIHVECHTSAVRSARGRDEWESAALQNANTRCNGLLPIWGPQVPEPIYASALARHNTYIQECTGSRDVTYHTNIHDIRLQLMRFAQERSFSEDSGGGGPQSNIHLIPYLMQTALYVLNSTKAATREYKRALNFLEMSSNEIIENCYDVDSPYYWLCMAIMVLPPVWWRKKRMQYLQRVLICNHVRRVSIKPPAPISDKRVRAFSYYKSALIFFAFIDSFYNIVFKDAPSSEDKWNQDWSLTLAEYLKHNDQTVNDNIEVLLNLYQNSLQTCTSLERFFEIIRLDEITHPNEFLAKTLESV